MKLVVYLTFEVETGVKGKVKEFEVYVDSIHHCVANMASNAGVYEVVWNPESFGITRAAQLIEALEKGVAALKNDPERFRKDSPKTSWSDYVVELRYFLEGYLEACRKYPAAKVSVSR